MNTFAGEKRRQILLSWFVEDGEVAPINHLHAEAAGGPYQIAKTGMQFRGSTGEVEHLELEMLQHLGNQINVAIGHHFPAPGPCIHVAVTAALIAAVAEVDLKRLQGASVE